MQQHEGHGGVGHGHARREERRRVVHQLARPARQEEGADHAPDPLSSNSERAPS